MKIRLFTIAATILLFAYFNCALAEQKLKRLHFGVLSYRPKEITTAQWLPLAKELEKNLPGYSVELMPLTYPELDKAATDLKLDFILTNPEHYILLKNRIGINAVATMITLEKGHPLTSFAGVIFTRADRTDIQTLVDLNDKTIASPSEESLGGYLMQRWELEKNNIVAKKYIFTGMPHDKVVDEVLLRKADAGFVRSGLLEKLEQAGKIRLGKNPAIRVLTSHVVSDEIPVLHSTAHYPEWAFCVAKQINTDIARQISLVLLNIKPDSEVAKTAGIAGFNSPADYTSVEVLMLRLKAHPDELKYFNFSDVLWRYRNDAIIVTVIAFLMLALIVSLILTNRKLKTTQMRLYEFHAEISLLLNSISEGAYGVDNQGFCLFVNNSFLTILGYESANEVVGQHIHELIHHSHADGKPYPSSECKMYNAYREHRNIRVTDEVFWRKDGVAIPVEYSSQPIVTDGILTGAIATFVDITERKKAEKEIAQLAFFDPLTGLPNRRKLLDRLNYSIQLSHREGKVFAVFMMDLDKFKAVNDSLGHAAGDDLLKQVAKRMTKRLRDSDMVARLGGDEFVIVLENCPSPEHAAKVATAVITDLTVEFELSSGHVVQIGASIGISFYPQDGVTFESLMDNADTALYQAKDNGRGCFVCYENQTLKTNL